MLFEQHLDGASGREREREQHKSGFFLSFLVASAQGDDEGRGEMSVCELVCGFCPFAREGRDAKNVQHKVKRDKARRGKGINDLFLDTQFLLFPFFCLFAIPCGSAAQTRTPSSV
jgi:hypothetical protein